MTWGGVASLIGVGHKEFPSSSFGLGCHPLLVGSALTVPGCSETSTGSAGMKKDHTALVAVWSQGGQCLQASAGLVVQDLLESVSLPGVDAFTIKRAVVQPIVREHLHACCTNGFDVRG